MVKTWIVYKHVSPSNKVYVGITSQSNIKRRWFRGSGYNRCPIFMKAILNGKKCTKEQIQANIERNLARSNPVLQFDLQGNFIKEYRSVKFAAESMGGSRGSLLNCLNPLRTESKTFKGYIWKYKNQ